MDGPDLATARAALLVERERLLGDRGVAASYAAQLCRRYAESQECRALKSGAQ